MARLLITGSNGLLGAALVRHAAAVYEWWGRAHLLPRAYTSHCAFTRRTSEMLTLCRK